MLHPKLLEALERQIGKIIQASGFGRIEITMEAGKIVDVVGTERERLNCSVRETTEG